MPTKKDKEAADQETDKPVDPGSPPSPEPTSWSGKKPPAQPGGELDS